MLCSEGHDDTTYTFLSHGRISGSNGINETHTCSISTGFEQSQPLQSSLGSREHPNNFAHHSSNYDNSYNHTFNGSCRPPSGQHHSQNALDHMSNGDDNVSNGQDQIADRTSEFETKMLYERQAEQQHQRKRKFLFTQEPKEKHLPSVNVSSRAILFDSPQTQQRRVSPKYRSYMNIETRVKSYFGFLSACNKSPETFAACGFFYKGFSDIVACFQCGFTYKNWHMNDDPFFIHKTFQSECDFIQQLHLDGVHSSADLEENLEKDVEMKEVTKETAQLSISK